MRRVVVAEGGAGSRGCPQARQRSFGRLLRWRALAQLRSRRAASLGNLPRPLLARVPQDDALQISHPPLHFPRPAPPPQFVFRKARALSLKGDHAEADALFAEASELDPSLAADAERERAANRARLRAAEARQRAGFGGFFQRPAARAAQA